MERLPKKYFGSISDYVKTYYTAWGVTNFADKAYTAIKTVTKDFTRTDPVFVRVGEDGEPEIHYTMTQANGNSLFNAMKLENVTVYLHNAKIVTDWRYCFANIKSSTAFVIDDISGVTNSYYLTAFVIYASGINRFVPKGIVCSFDISAAALKHDAILEVFNNLGTVDKTAGITLTLGSEKLALMSDDEKAIATEKGWFLA